MSTTSVSTQSATQNGVHPSAVGSGTRPDTSRSPVQSRTTYNEETAENKENGGPPPGGDSEYPEQKHAGAVGLGPTYNQGAGFTDKVVGLKEEIKGKITKNPDLVQRGKERKTGELKRKELEDDDDPFAVPDDKDKDAPAESGDLQQKNERGENEGAAIKSNNSQHNIEREEKEEAATVAPEGTREAETQRKGENVDDVKTVG